MTIMKMIQIVKAWLRCADNLNRSMQNNKYAKFWALGAMAFVSGASLCLWHLNYIKSPFATPTGIRRFAALMSLEVTLAIIHIFVFFATPRLRSWGWIRCVPISPVMAFVCTFCAYVPLGCTLDGSLSSTESDVYSLLTTGLFAADFFCLHMAILPRYDYMIVHITVGIVGTVVLGIVEHSRWRVYWMVFAAVCTFWFLTLHHWFTSPAAVRECASVVIDARYPRVGLPPLPAEVRGPDQSPCPFSDETLTFFFRGGFLLIPLPVIFVVLIYS